MDTLEVAIPEAAAAVTVSKLVGSEGFGSSSGAGVEVGKVDSGRPEDTAVNASEPTLWNKVHNAGRYVPVAKRTSFRSDAQDFNLGNTNGSISLITGKEAIELHRRSAKVSRSSTSGSKRSRIVQMEISGNESRVEDIKGNSTGLGSCPGKSVITEKSQIPRQKNNGNGKRGDKRNGRVHKSRLDTFSLKNGLVNLSSVACSGNFLAYGSKSNTFDATKHDDEPPLSELLDGSYNCPSLVKDKAKVVQNSSENLLNSIRKVYSILRLQSPVHAQHSADVDNNYNQKVSSAPVNADTSPSSRDDGGKRDCGIFNESASDKESCGRVGTLATAMMVDSPLYPPKDILERLALPQSKELDSLLLDAVKPASTSRNNSELRLGKAVLNRTGLPPFSWSHNFSGNSKSGPDTVKISTNRTTCQGRWVKVENTLKPLTDDNCFPADLKSLTYDHRLVPIGNLESGPSEKQIFSPACGDFTPCNQDLSSTVSCSASHVPSADYSPRLLAAAETLCEIASRSSKRNQHRMMKWLKRPSRRTMKACKLKLNEKSERHFAAPKAPTGSDSPVKVADGMFPLKKLKFKVEEKPVDVCHKNSSMKGPTNRADPKSVRPSSSKVLRDSVPETKYSRTSTVKRSYMMPPPARVLDKDWSSQQKHRKMAPTAWSQTGSKLD